MRGIWVSAILTALILGLTVSHVSAQENVIEVYGRVLDAYTGEPIANATLIFLDWRTQSHSVVWTDSRGEYHAHLETYRLGELSEYVIYVLHFDENGLIDYVPAVYPENVYDAERRVKETLELNFNLVPGAVVEIKPSDKSEMWYVLSKRTPFWYSLEVVDASTFESPSLPSTAITVYGEPPYMYSRGPDVRFLPKKYLQPSVTVVPAGKPVYVMLRMEFDNEYTDRREAVSTLIGLNGKPIELRQGDKIQVDVKGEIYGISCASLEKLSKLLEEELVKAEGEGFYVGAEREDLMDIIAKIGEAKRLLPPVNPDPTEDELKKARFQYLEEAYYEIRRLEDRLTDMRMLAQTHSVFFPFFFAVFSLILGVFLFEDWRKKVATALIAYPTIVASLFYIYPGFRIMFSPKTVIHIEAFGIKFLHLEQPQVTSFFLALIVAAIAAVLCIYTAFPKIYREPEVEGRASLKSIISVIFSIGKRNVKRRKLRSALCMVALTLLIMVFTAFTSFSRVQGLVIEGPHPTATEVSGCFIRKTPFDLVKPSSVGELMTEEHLLTMKAYGVEEFIVKVENVPSTYPILRIKTARGKTADVYGVLGVDPNESMLTATTTYVPSKIFENGLNLGLTRSLASKLGVKPGDRVIVSSLTDTGVEVARWNFTVAGYVDEGIFEVKDLDGNLFIPFKALPDGAVEPVKAEELIVVNARVALDIRLHHSVGISRAFTPISGEDAVTDFARRMAYREYYVLAFHGGGVAKYYIGEVWEIKGWLEFLVPATLVFFNVFLVMVNLVYERRREIPLMTALGLNPAHIASVFLAESIVMGLIAGGIGYYAGLGAYRLMSLLGPSGQIGVRAKLEWYWSVIGVAISITVAVLSSVVPAIRAAVMATPSLVKRVKIPEAEKAAREEKIFKVYHERTVAMPVKVHVIEKPFFVSYISDRLKELAGYFYERVEDLEIEEELLPNGSEVVRIKFTHIHVKDGKEYSTANELRALRKAGSKTFELTLISKPKTPGMPERAMERTVSLTVDLLKDWSKEKRSLLGAAK